MLRRNPWMIVGLGILAIFTVLVASGFAYWRYLIYVPDYPQPRVVIPVPNAYDDYVAAGKMSTATGGTTVPQARAPGPEFGYSGGPSPSGASPRYGYEENVPLEQVRAVVARNRAALAKLRQGFGKEFLNPPITSWSQTFPELADYRELARVLVTEGKLAEREGRTADAARSYLDCLHLGVDVPRGGVLIHALVGIAIQVIGLGAMADVADRLDGPSALAAARAMARLDLTAAGAADAMQAEKDATTATLVEMFRKGIRWRDLSSSLQGGSSGSFPSIPETLFALQFTLTPRRQTIDSYRAYLDAVIADARQPYYAPTTLPPVPNDPLNRILMPVFSQTKFAWARRDAHWRITELRLAARAYQARHGAPPATAAALVPGYLPAVPRDPFADKPLVYRVKGSRPVIYSRGPDGDDDGGQDLGTRVQPGMNGDLVSLKRRGG